MKQRDRQPRSQALSPFHPLSLVTREEKERESLGTRLRGRYFRVAVTFGWLKNVCNSAAVLHKEDAQDFLRSSYFIVSSCK